MPVYTPATSGRQLQDVLQSISAPGQRWDMVVVVVVVDAVIHDAPEVRDDLQLWGTAGSVNGNGKRFPFPAVVLLSFTAGGDTVVLYLHSCQTEQADIPQVWQTELYWDDYAFPLFLSSAFK